MLLNLLFFSAPIMLAVQIVLCLNLRRRIWKVLPLIVLTVLPAVCFLASVFTSDWTSIGWWVIGCFLLFPLGGCALGWLIAFLIRKWQVR